MVSRLTLNLRDDNLQRGVTAPETEFSSIGPHFPTLTETIDEVVVLPSWRGESSLSFSSDGTRYVNKSAILGSHSRQFSLISASATTLGNTVDTV